MIGNFANGAATAAMSYALSSVASDGGGQRSSQSDVMSMSDQEMDAYIEAQYGDQLNLNTDMLLAECIGCMAQDRLYRSHFSGNATEADLMGLHRAQGAGVLTGLSLMGPGGFARMTYWGARTARAWSRSLGPSSRIFGTRYYRNGRNAGLLNGNKTLRVGWSYNQKTTGRLHFTVHRGVFHLDKYYDPISIRPPRVPGR